MLASFQILSDAEHPAELQSYPGNFRPLINLIFNASDSLAQLLRVNPCL
jgi:hypothetical protein